MNKELKINNDGYMSQGRKEYGHEVVIFPSEYLREAKWGYTLGKQEWLMNFSIFMSKGVIVFIPLIFLALIANGGWILSLGLTLIYLFISATAIIGNTFNNCLSYALGDFKTARPLCTTLDNLNTILPRYVMELDQIYGKGKHLMSVPPEEERREKEREKKKKWMEEKEKRGKRLAEIKERIEEEKKDPKINRQGDINPINCSPDERKLIIELVQTYRDLLDIIDDTRNLDEKEVKEKAKEYYDIVEKIDDEYRKKKGIPKGYVKSAYDDWLFCLIDIIYSRCSWALEHGKAQYKYFPSKSYETFEHFGLRNPEMAASDYYHKEEMYSPFYYDFY